MFSKVASRAIVSFPHFFVKDVLGYRLIDCIDCMVFNAVSTVFHLYRGGQCTYPCFPGVLLTSTPHNILSKPLAAFPHLHSRNNGQR